MDGRRALCILLLCGAGLCPGARAQESTNFVMESVGVVSAGQSISSASYDATVVLDPRPVGVASSCNSGFVTRLGFLTAYARVPVPIKLYLAKGAGESTATLLWTGDAEVFEVYRSPSPVDLTDPANLFAVVTPCVASDVAATSDIVFYEVVAQPSPAARPAPSVAPEEINP